MTAIGMVGSDISGIGTNRRWLRKIYLLPTGGSFIAKGGSCKSGPSATPKRTGVCTGIIYPLVKPDP